MSKYQVMPPLSDEQYEALKADIATAGVRVPIEVDESGEVIDGHHRRAIAMELGIECPEVVVRGLEEFEKLDRAFVLNATRRHFNREQHRAVVVKSLMLHPRLADREHARRCGVSHPTVADVRSALVAAGRLESFTSRVGGDGRERPARNEPTRKSEPKPSGLADDPSPADESGEDRTDEEPGRADPADSSAQPEVPGVAPGSAPAEQEESPDSPPVDEPERAGLGVAPPAPAPPKPFEFPDVEKLRQRTDLDQDAVEEYARKTAAHELAKWRDDLTTAFVNFRKVFRSVSAQDFLEKADDELINLFVNTHADLEEKWRAVAELKVAAAKANVVQLRRVQ